MQIRLATVLMCIVLFGTAHAQKGAFSIAAGPFISVPVGLSNVRIGYLKPGAGLVAIGQYNVSLKSALLLQASIAVYGTKPWLNTYTGDPIFMSSLCGGYRYQLSSAGYFINVLAGFSGYSIHGLSSTDFALGTGKRIIIKEVYFIDAGVDFIFGHTSNRFNIKVAFSLLRRPKVK